MIAFEGGLITGGSLLIMGPRIGAPASTTATCSGAAAGILFGVSDVAIKALSGLVGIGWADGSGQPVDTRLRARLGGRLLRLGQGASGRPGRSR